jgi:ParB family chromosome partitioning protein
MQQMNIPLERLVVSALNARTDLIAGQEDSGIEELASSIQKQGLLSPLVVRAMQDGRYEVLVGQRRLLACRKLALSPVPCWVRDDLADADAVAISLVENVHRADMHPLDKARALKKLYDRHQSYERVARETAWSVSTIRKYIQLLDLPDEIQGRLCTANGASGVSALARLSSTFSGDEAVEVYDRISGFTQRIQEEILKRSGGNMEAVEDLVEEAQEGAFDVRRCGARFGCDIIRQIRQHQLTEADFHKMIEGAGGTPRVFDEALRDASRTFWKLLAAG